MLGARNTFPVGERSACEVGEDLRKLGTMAKRPKQGDCEIVDLAQVRALLEARKDREKTLASLHKPGDRIMHMGLDVNVDKAPDDYLERYILPFVTKEGGAQMSVEEFRASCADLRRAGFEVIPTCANVDERGRCKGCELKIGGS